MACDASSCVCRETVADVGCGTGLSTIIWKYVATNIVGLEPNDEMRAVAEKHAICANISYKNAVSNNTKLPDEYADVITVSQAFHWMDIDSTLTEFYRVLKPSGILAIWDVMLPPVVDWEVEKAFVQLRQKCNKIYYAQENPPVHNDKSSFYRRINDFEKFRYVRECYCHSKKTYSAQEAVDFFFHLGCVPFTLTVDPTIQKDSDALAVLIKEKCRDNFNIILPYTIVLAVK